MKDTTAVKVSAILIKYQRIDELAKIIETLKQYPFIDEILIHDNTKQNIKMYGRYYAVRRARNQMIYVQDDDCIVGNLNQIYNYFVKGKCTELVNGMKPERAPFYAGLDTLVGWGAFFNKDWIGVLDWYLDKYGMDQIFLRETDRIFTSLCRAVAPRVTVPAVIMDFPSAMSPNALSLQREHEQSRAEAVSRCKEILHAYRT